MSAWRGKWGKARLLAAGALLLACGAVFARGQQAPTQAATASQSGATSAAAQPDDAKPRAVLNAMIKALGGDAWLHLQGYELIGRTSGFYQGQSTGDIEDFWDYRAFPDHERIELGKKRQVFEIFNGNEGWEITYRGKRAIKPEEMADYLRRRDHSVEVALKLWLNQPGVILIDGGQQTVERHLADKVTLISPENDSITLEADAETHLPLRRTFQWRDPLYKDKNTETEEYDDYHTINGIATPFNITRSHNGDMTNQRFLYNVVYAGAIPPEMFDVEAAVRKLKK